MGVDTHMPWCICRGQRMPQEPVPPFTKGSRNWSRSIRVSRWAILGFYLLSHLASPWVVLTPLPLLMALFPWLVTNWSITWFCSIEHGAQAKVLCRWATPTLLAPRYLFLFLSETGLKLRAILLPQASLALQMLKLQAWGSTHTRVSYFEESKDCWVYPMLKSLHSVSVCCSPCGSSLYSVHQAE